jgi:glycosyltransferase involved in cell wall biosynthesis
MSNAGLEALERGLPLLLSRCGGLDAYVSSRIGWVVTPGDVDDLSLALKSALATSLYDLASMGRAARALVEDTFDMAVVGRRYEGLFQALLEGRQA